MKDLYSIPQPLLQVFYARAMRCIDRALKIMPEM
jgi:hypothetical protein